MKTQRIWVDMTDLNVWSGYMTGIQRVVYQQARRFAESSEHEAHFFVFDEAAQTCSEVSFADIQARIDATQRDEHSEPTAPTAAQRIKSLPRALVRRIPDPVKRRVPASAKRQLKRGFRLGVRVLRRANKLVRPPRQAVIAPVQFTAADTILILGKSWDSPRFIPMLGRLKLAHGFRLVHLIHDMIPTLEPHLFGPGLFEPYTKTMFEVCSLADGLLAQSRSTKRDIERFCQQLFIPQPPISVIRLGDDIALGDVSDDYCPDPRFQKGQFLLHAATVEVRKNHLLDYLAYREAARRGIDLPPLAIMGPRGWLTDDVVWQIEHDPLIKNKIILLGAVNDHVRQWLFRNCRFTVSPSVYEGWGMPVAESVASGKLCLAADASSLPEIAGDLLEYYSPYDPAAFLNLMVKYLDDKTLRAKEKELAAKYKPHTWDQTFAQTTRFLASL